MAGSAAAMSKYFGVAVVPLLVVYWIARHRRGTWHLLGLSLPVVTLILWGMYSKAEGNVFHPLGAASYSMSEKLFTDYFLNASVSASFLGGSLLWPVLILPLAVRLPIEFSGPIGIVAFIFCGYWFMQLPLEAAILCSIFMLAGAFVVAAAAASCLKRRDVASLLLGLWFFGTMTFVALLNWTVNARIVLPAVLPAAVLIFRWIETLEGREFWFRWLRRSAWPVAIVSVLLAVSDYRFAQSGQNFARKTVRKLIEDGNKVYFAGHWGFQFYMEREGAAPIDFLAVLRDPRFLKANDYIVYPHPAFNTNVLLNRDGSLMLASRSGLEVKTRTLVSHQVRNPLGFLLISAHASAGFYSHEWGPLPFNVGWNPVIDAYSIDRVEAIERSAPRPVLGLPMVR
jgi:hypothetical protein